MADTKYVIALACLAALSSMPARKDPLPATTRKLVDVMRKDSTQSSASGGWQFEEFVGETRVRKEGIQSQCAQCHAARRDSDYVFSRYSE